MSQPPQAPVRIGFCITELEPGGAERCLTELVTRIDRERFEPVVYCLAGRPADNPSSLARRIEAAGVPLHCFNATSTWAAPRVLGKLRRRLREDRPQVLQTFLAHANVLGGLAARLAGVKRVVTGIRVAERRKFSHLAVARAFDWTADVHVCVSEAVREFSLTQAGLAGEKLRVIGNGVDLARFTDVRPVEPASLGVQGRFFTFVGRIDKQKGVGQLLASVPQIFANLSERGVDDVELVLVGEGRDRAKLSARLPQDLARRVHFVGFRHDVPAILAASDLLVLPSQWEGMPNVVLEAMASGLPVVANDVEGVRDVLGPNSGPQVVPADSPDRFSQRVVDLLANRQKALEIGEKNRAHAARHSLESMVAGYERIYRELLSRVR